MVPAVTLPASSRNRRGGLGVDHFGQRRQLRQSRETSNTSLRTKRMSRSELCNQPCGESSIVPIAGREPAATKLEHKRRAAAEVYTTNISV